ncbi:hypothetical protein CEUSTIGMA_g9686.t1 [Chlamydomonas eustigma]|uniref:Glycosyltransferase family 92 protein n=1 Tax=Chlamydomonas eustigma TaxID=1157962 RepID=A0A250XGQ8_9CHLO|nr:hypothetical protein CEUSTIGMA_g9686.t1 [Chlamydomonas eustigma]|eukprot:GAX82258.1 hypothetical protein CEUSTIGMA_g9686.t1 [Chlamydomonas eustigma]
MQALLLMTFTLIVAKSIVPVTCLRPYFIESSDIGVSKCTMQGVFGEDHATLHLWIRADVDVIEVLEDGKYNQAQLRVKGFFVFESLEQGWEGPQLMQSEEALSSFSFQIHIRPHLGSSSAWELTAWDMKKQTKNNVLPFWGNFTLYQLPASHSIWEYEVSVEGLDYTCQLVADVHAPPVRMNSNEVDGETSSLEGGQSSDGTTDYSKALGRPGQVSFLLSPLFGSGVSAYASVLAWHIAWHQKFGVDIYVLYVTRQMTELLENPMIQMMVQKNLLKLIMWIDMPTPLRGTPYAHQVIIYNHGILSLMAENSLVIVADLDEYLLTPEPMSIHQVMSNCVEEERTVSATVATLNIKRFNILNKTSADSNVSELPQWIPQLGDSHTLNSSQWMDLQLPSLAEHPLKMYTSQAAYRPESGFAKKPIHRPQLCKAIKVHGGFPMDGMQEVQANPACARLLHVVNMNQPRMLYPQKMNPIMSKWFWPMKEDNSDGGVSGMQVVR